MALQHAIRPADVACGWHRVESLYQSLVRGGVDFDRELPERAVLITAHTVHMLEKQARFGDDAERA